MSKVNVMKSTLLVAGIGLLILFATGCDKLRSRDALNHGVQAYKGAHYTEAVDFFKTAVQLDPDNIMPRLYLATAYMSQYIPGAESPENLQLAKQAKEEFIKVLEKTPSDTTALASLASLSYQQAQGMPDLEQKLKKLDESKEWYLKLIAADPQNKEGFYSLAVIDWVKWYAAWMTARNDLGLKTRRTRSAEGRKGQSRLADPVRRRNRRRHQELAEGPGYRSELRRRDGVHEPSDTRESRSGRLGGPIQGRRRDRRQMGAESRSTPRRPRPPRQPRRRRRAVLRPRTRSRGRPQPLCRERPFQAARF